jgi:hypothetical protein
MSQFADSKLRQETFTVSRNDSNFDKACDAALKEAVYILKIDEDGHSPIEGWERSCCWFEIEFQKYTACLNYHRYTFQVTAYKCEDEDET